MKDISKKLLIATQTSIFIAIILSMSFIPFLGYIPLGFTKATLVHIPVVIGALVLGPKKGALLGFVFGLTSFIMNTFNPTLISFVFSPFYSIGDIHGNFFSIITCFVPRILTGIVPYYVFVLTDRLKHLKPSTKLIISGIIGSLTNTILVMSFILVFFKNSYAAVNNVSSENLYLFILFIIGTNGIFEAIICSILTCIIVRAINAYKLKK